MIDHYIYAKLLSKKRFKKFGEVIETDGSDFFSINNNRCKRFDSLGNIDIDFATGKPIISIFRSQSFTLPHKVTLFERHPFGSQAFLPLHTDPFLVIMAENKGEAPHGPKAFITNGHQGINIFRNTWHGILTPIVKQTDFIVVDRSEAKTNVEEYYLEVPIHVKLEDENP